MKEMKVARFAAIFAVLFQIQLVCFASLARQKRDHLTCGKQHREAPGFLTSPNYPNVYPSETDCQWIISTTDGKMISLKFLKFEFESHESCDYDHLEIYDGNSRHARKLGRFCGTKLPDKLTSSGSKLFVVFHSDPAVEARGFRIQYSTSYGCDQVFTGDSGEILSPNYPGQHPQPMQCDYNINVTSGKSIRLTFEEFNLEEPSVNSVCEYDYIEVYDGPTMLHPSMGRFCGNRLPSVKASTNNKLLIRFVADTTVTKTGFRIKYYAKGTTINEICNRPAYTGNCRADMPRWFYNTETKQCETFSYGGCNSNGNNFRTKAECARQCRGESPSDFNECSRKNGGCDQACHNTLESYFCSCWKGYRIADNQHACEDVDECALGHDVHHCEQNCTNMPGSYYCTCTQGFQLSANRRTCNDINECLLGGGACQQECFNTPGSYHCGCFKGYEAHPGRSKGCRDINECDMDLPDCHKCYNFEGGYSCECNTGFKLSENKSACFDVNECLDDNGGCSQLCVNRPGNYSCQCKEGFYPTDSASVNCEDIDECSGNNGKGNCEYKCENAIGSFNCSCQEGCQLGEDKLSCLDINECGNNNGGCTQKCVNLPASYKCVCHDGFEEIGKNGTDVICKDIDECTVGSHQCDIDLGASCVNQIGNYSCNCPSGYNSEWKNCADVDECGDSTINDCQQQCNNTPGSFRCTCFEGYSLNEDGKTCTDIDECASSPCDHSCVNSVGSFACYCETGYLLGQDGKTCLDVNECQFQNGLCDQICRNTNGSFKCECHAGFKLLEDGRTCMDIDECNEETVCCDSMCINTPGGYSCGCNEGHFLSRDNCTCQDTNECTINNGGCDHTCNNTKGGFSCSCRDGYKIDPTNTSRCLDVNECLQDNGGCSQFCNNTEGSYECYCKPVFKLGPDGKTCDHCPSCETFEALINQVEKLRIEVELLKQKKSNCDCVRKSGCLYKDKSYKDGDLWKDGDCKSCLCQQAQVICFQDKECFQSDSGVQDTAPVIPPVPRFSTNPDKFNKPPPITAVEDTNHERVTGSVKPLQDS